jgi:hypothetical protein
MYLRFFPSLHNGGAGDGAVGMLGNQRVEHASALVQASCLVVSSIPPLAVLGYANEEMNVHSGTKIIIIFVLKLISAPKTWASSWLHAHCIRSLVYNNLNQG